MSDFWLGLLVFAAAVNPAGTLATLAGAPADVRARRNAAVFGFLVAAALLLAATFASGGILDALALEAETFRISAGIVMAASGVAAVFFGPFTYPVEAGGRGALFPLAFPLLASPAALVAAIARASDSGEVETAGGALLVVAATAALAALLAGRAPALLDALARLTGALLIVLATSLVVDGIRAV